MSGYYKAQDELSYARISTRIALLIATGCFKNKSPNKIKILNGIDSQCYIVAVCAGGGLATLDLVACAVDEMIPLLVLKGSGRLCNILPKLYLERFSSAFDINKKGKQFMEECGFNAASNDDRVDKCELLSKMDR